MRDFIRGILVLVLILVISTCYPWDLEKRDDHDAINGNGESYITFDTLYGTNMYDEATAVIITNDGAYAIIGQTTDPVDDDNETYMLKIDTSGDIKWPMAFNNNDDDYGMSLMQLDDDNFIILGNLDTDANAWQNLMIETDGSGNLQDQNNYGLNEDDKVFSFVSRVNADGYLLFGYTETYKVNDLGLQAMLFIINNDLNEESRINMGGTYDDYGYYIERTEDNQYVVLVSMGQQDQTRDLHLMKLNLNHEAVWDEEIIVNAQPVLGCVRQIQGGGFIVGGAISGNRVRLVKTDENGQNPVVETYDDRYADSAVSVIPTMDGGFAVLTSDMVLFKTNSNLHELWYQEFEGEAHGNYAIKQTSDGGFILVGTTENTENSSYDIRVIKTDPSGNVK